MRRKQNNGVRIGYTLPALEFRLVWVHRGERTNNPIALHGRDQPGWTVYNWCSCVSKGTEILALHRLRQSFGCNLQNLQPFSCSSPRPCGTMATLQSAAIPALKSQIDAAVAEEDGIPGAQYYAVNKNGEYIFEHTSGKTGLGSQDDMRHDNVFWIASCTKLITSIACMQLVEQGKLALDDVAQVESLAPVGQV